MDCRVKPGNDGDWHQSARTPLSWITFAHFAVSLSMYALNSSGDLLATAMAPTLRMRAWIAGSASTLTIAACSFSMIGRGVPDGTSTPCQDEGTGLVHPSSGMVGMSGSSAIRCRVVTASALTLLPFTNSIAD